MSSSADVEHLRLALQRIASLVGGAPEQAALQAEEILKAFPGQLNATTLLAAAQRRTGNQQSALKLLDEVIEADPRFALAHQERGFTLIDLNQSAEAEAALETAVELEPEMHLGWKALGDLRAARGDQPGSEQAYQNHVSAVAGDPELVEAANLLFNGKLAKAEQLCREYLKKDPTDPSAIRMLAEIGIKLGRVDDAEKLLRRCLELAPDFHLARSNFANVLFKKLRYEPALTEIEKVLHAEPDHPSHLLLKASILGRIGDMEGAIAIYGQVLRKYPQQSRAHLSLGHMLKTVGRQEAAIESYRTGIAQRPGLGEAYWSLANLKTFQFTEDELALMKDQVTKKHNTPEDYFNLYFALGKAQEDRGEFDDAFHSYQKGNAIRRRTVRWDADEHHENTQRLKRFFVSDLFAQRSGTGCSSDSPIFIVGLPRSGSTLLEQILASHSQVEGTMELPDIISIARRLSGKKSKHEESRYPEILAEMNRDALGEIGREYLQRTVIYRTNTPRFIDKMPNNFTHVGLIHLILPNARIIDARRHPIGCCFSGYKQLFAAGQNFSYNLTEIGRYYRDYVELMEHWDMVLPGRVLRVAYEEVVADIEGQVRRLLKHCDLPFESACLEFYRTNRAIRTASSEQVRQPIYQEAVEQWRQFEDHLDPLVDALGPNLTTDLAGNS